MNSFMHVNSPVAALHEPISSGHGQSILKSRVTPSLPSGFTSSESNVVYKGFNRVIVGLNLWDMKDQIKNYCPVV